MDAHKKSRLTATGYSIGDAREFLGLTDAEQFVVELRLRLSQQLRQRRVAANLTQTAIAKRLGSSQSRVAKMEAADSSVSLELLISGLMATGADRREVAAVMADRLK
jgi:hypothetical protein